MNEVTTLAPVPPVSTRSHRLEGLLNPRSVAIIGASERNHYSNLAINALRGVGFDGKLHLVNRRGAPAYGQDSVVDCKSIGEPVDAAYFCVPSEGLLDAVRDALDAGIRNLVVVSSGFAEVGSEGVRREAQLKAMCDAVDARVLGPNCLGFRNVLDGVALGSIPFVDQTVAGSIAVVAVSGSVASTTASYGIQQGIGFTHVIATGNEMNVASADLVDYLIDIPEVKAIALFIETVKDTGQLAAVAERARAARKPIVAIKVGSAPATAAIAAAHTSAVVGDDRVFDAACDRLGIVRVGTIEDLVITAAAIASTGPIEAPGVAFVSISGGISEIASDLGAEVGVILPQFAAETKDQLAEVLSDMGQMHNPLDLTGAAVRDESLWTTVPAIVSRDPAVGLTLINWDLPAVAEPSMPGTLEKIGEAHKGVETPTLLISNTERPVNAFGLAYLQKHGMSFALPGMAHGLKAASKLAWWSERLQRVSPAAYPAAPTPPLARPGDERAALAHLARHGAPVVPTIVARTASEAVAAALAIGGRVAMKILSPDIAHKSDIGGVALNLEGPEAVGQAYDRMMRAVASHVPDAAIEGVIIAPMRSGGLELLVGVARDPHWGLVMALGLGGVWTEVLNDTALCLLPASRADLVRALQSLKAARLFDGYRGGPAADLDAVADAAARIGEAAAALGPDLVALEVNPLFVRGNQVEALDALATWAS